MIPAIVITIVAGLVWWPNEVPDTASRLPAAVSELKFRDTDRNPDAKVVAREAENQSGLIVRRARKVNYDSDPLRDALWPGDRTVAIELFNDVKIRVRFMAPSPQLNRRGEFVGQVDGDPDSRVQLWSTDRRLTGEILTHGKTFRFVPVTGRIHFIIEVETRDP